MTIDNAQLFLTFSVTSVPRADGSFVVTPVRPVAKRPTMSAAQAALRADVDVKTIYRAFEAGEIEGFKPTPRKVRLYSDSVEQYIARTRDPEYWDRKRRAAWAQAR